MAIVCIRLGQSNSRGKAATSGMSAGYKQEFPNVKTWNGTAFASLDWAVPNNCYPTPTAEGGSEFAILTQLQTYKAETIYDIKYAVGGTSLGTYVDAINNWNATTSSSYFEKSCSAINGAMNYLWNTLGVRTFTFYVFWDQGESDARSLTDSNNYQSNLLAFYNALSISFGTMTKTMYWINPRVNTTLPVSGTGAIITGATNASPIVITTSPTHGLTTKQTVNITGVVGNTAANGTFEITVVNSTTFSLNGSVGNGVYSSGGTLDSWFYRSNINAAQSAAAIPNKYTLACESFQLQADNIHYTSAGYEAKGDAEYAIITSNGL